MKRCCRCYKDISDGDYFGHCKSCISDKGSYNISDKIFITKLWAYVYVENSDNKFCVIDSDLIYELLRKIPIDNLIYDEADNCIKCGSELFRDIVERISGRNCSRVNINPYDLRTKRY